LPPARTHACNSNGVVLGSMLQMCRAEVGRCGGVNPLTQAPSALPWLVPWPTPAAWRRCSSWWTGDVVAAPSIVLKCQVPLPACFRRSPCPPAPLFSLPHSQVWRLPHSSRNPTAGVHGARDAQHQQPEQRKCRHPIHHQAGGQQTGRCCHHKKIPQQRQSCGRQTGGTAARLACSAAASGSHRRAWHRQRQPLRVHVTDAAFGIGAGKG
jgi:hypothetical protein